MRKQLLSLIVPAILFAPVPLAMAQAPKPSVSGMFKGNGKDAKIAFVSAHWREPFNDKPGIRLVFTERDHSKDPKPDFGAAFGRFGSALIVSLHEDGGIFGCEVAHSAHKGTFSSIGRIKTNDFKVEGGLVQGQLSTGGQQDVFGETWEVDLKFAAPLAAAAPQAAPTPAPTPSPPPAPTPKVAKKTPAAPGKSPARPSENPGEKQPAAALNVKDLPIPKDATDVEYKTLVQHINFKSPADVKTLAADLSKKLADQGWTSDGPDLLAPMSSILKRKRGAAKLTIFVKPAASGSQVQIFSEGLSWEGK